jgi:hypothetical protein
MVSVWVLVWAWDRAWGWVHRLVWEDPVLVLAGQDKFPLCLPHEDQVLGTGCLPVGHQWEVLEVLHHSYPVSLHI